ncbi:hypothetical protein [Maribacter sp. MAR_2009_72]|uniref:hypothetical protein n=1 Tax=Maribacter sp. MAR_2009_72 TaxID=1250050 RepID=UPI00119B54E9|nr:hypothetical protein [Maribacter sp. MAR_2009_72]TVZ16576.1 hypothetical protein JM81_2839 [Maribacter sp. MAR_2009_72]
MKKISIALMAIVCSFLLYSCTTDSVAEIDGLYNTQSTEGDDGDPPPPPPPPPPGANDE